VAKKKKKSGGGGGDSARWMVTFSDLMTLLLTFFVLLLSMASMDKSVLTKITLFTKELGVMTYKGSGRLPTRFRAIIDLLERPWELMEKQNRIKDLLFPDDMLPPEISRSTLEENLRVLARPEGVALILTDKLLFPSGGSKLGDPVRVLLDQLAQVLTFMNAPVNIAGYTDTDPGVRHDNYELSGLRALSVLEFFLSADLPEERFSISGYGPHWALTSNETPEGKAQNRRVEILLKTTPWLGAYTQ